MFTVTQNEELMVMRIEGINNKLQDSIERVNSALQFHSVMPSKSRFPFVDFFRRMKLFSKEEKLYKLLSALTTIKAVFEVNKLIIVEGKLYFMFQDPSKGKNFSRKIGETQSTDDLMMYCIDLKKRLSDTLAQPEISQAIKSPLFVHYCPALARTNLSLSDSYQKYLGEAKAE